MIGAMAADGAAPEVLAWIQCSDMDRAADYLRRGRAFQSLPTPDLTDQWKLAVQMLNADITSDANRSREADLRAEFQLRNIAPPFQEMNEGIAAALARFQEWVEKIRIEDPERFNAIEAAIAQAISDLNGSKVAAN